MAAGGINHAIPKQPKKTSFSQVNGVGPVSADPARITSKKEVRLRPWRSAPLIGQCRSRTHEKSCQSKHLNEKTRTTPRSMSGRGEKRAAKNRRDNNHGLCLDKARCFSRHGRNHFSASRPMLCTAGRSNWIGHGIYSNYHQEASKVEVSVELFVSQDERPVHLKFRECSSQDAAIGVEIKRHRGL